VGRKWLSFSEFFVNENGESKDKDGNPVLVRESCIDSAQHIMQTIAMGLRPKTRSQVENGPPVKAYFATEKGTIPEAVQEHLKKALDGKNGIELIQSQGNNKKLTDLDPKKPEQVKRQLQDTVGVVINVSKGESLQDVGEHLINLGIPLADYQFKKLPDKGEGLICLNKTKEDKVAKDSFNMHLGAVVARNGDSALLSNMIARHDTSYTPEKELETIPIDGVDKFRSATFVEEKEQKDYALGLLIADKNTLSPRSGGGAGSSEKKAGEDSRGRPGKRKRDDDEEEAGVSQAR
jgi:hypothetical protein